MEDVAQAIDRADVDLHPGVVPERRLDLLGPLVVGALVLEVDQFPAASADVVAGLAGDRRPVLRVDDLHVGHVVVGPESGGQELRRKVADDHPHLLEDAVRVADLVDQLLLARAPPDGRALPEQPQPHREGATVPGRAHVPALLGEPVLLGRQAGHQEIDELVLASKLDERHESRRRRSGVPRIVGHAPVVDELLRPGAVIFVRADQLDRASADPQEALLTLCELRNVVRRPGLTRRHAASPRRRRRPPWRSSAS